MDEAVGTARAASSRELWDRLVRRAVGPPRTDEDDDEYMDLVAELNRRGEPEAVGWALDTLSSPEPALRQLAARVLADHGFEDDFPTGPPRPADWLRPHATNLTTTRVPRQLRHWPGPGRRRRLRRCSTTPRTPARA